VKTFPAILDMCDDIVVGNSKTITVEELARTAYQNYPYGHRLSMNNLFFFREDSTNKEKELLSSPSRLNLLGFPTSHGHRDLILEIFDVLIEEKGRS
jgi:hypothetical protein